MSVIEAVRAGWGWSGIDAVEVVDENDFGNLMVKDATGRYWRLCPEDLYCAIVAEDRQALDALSNDQTFLRDWSVSGWVDRAFEMLGVLPEGRKYCLKIPGVFGGEYGGANLATIGLEELVRASGDIARQIKDLPDGAQVQFKVTE
jgi:hypothetical protein